MSEYTLRPGTAADIETMARHRALMFADMGDGTPENAGGDERAVRAVGARTARVR
ncbi:MAG: hypothetical protein IPG47_03055 [Thermoflexaceae bacterium]|nr:hypothetical protein [Thermoflexaceae bacterium]